MRAILEAAERLLAERGAEGLTLRGVASACDIRLGHLQHFFSTRPALVQALLQHILERSEGELRASLSGLDLGSERSLQRVLDGMLRAQRQPGLARVFYELWALGARDRAIAGALARFYSAWARRVTELLAAREPRASRRQLLRRVQLFVCCLEGVSLLRTGVIGKSDRAFEQLARATLRQLLVGDGAR